MKRLISLFLTLSLLFGITGCGLDKETVDILADVAEIVSDVADEINRVESDEYETEELPTEEENSQEEKLKEENAKDSESDASISSSDADSNLAAEYSDDNSHTDVKSNEPSNDELYDILPEDGSYTKVEDVSLYIHLYKKLPDNFITKNEARELGWRGGGLDEYAKGMCIGGDKFGNYEELLPAKKGRTYTECDIDTLGKDSRGAKRIVFSNDGLIFYTDDHYESFTQLYDENGEV